MANFSDPLINGLISITETLRISFLDPADQIRILSPLSSYQPIGSLPGNLSTIQLMSAAECRRAALCSLANACANYNPVSTNDAQEVITLVRNLFNAEALYAADGLATGGAPEDDVWNYLTALRDSTIKDLKIRSTNLPTLTQFTERSSLPNFVIAYQHYQDATRQDEILNFNNDVPHPFLMPTTYLALSS